MSKKKKRYKRRKRLDSHRIRSLYDVHHLCFMRKNWNYGYAKAIRQFYYCKVKIQRDTLHRYIHENMSNIPTPGSSARTIYEQLLMLDRMGVLHDDDSIEKRLMVLTSLFDGVEQPTADALKRQTSIIQKFKNKPP